MSKKQIKKNTLKIVESKKKKFKTIKVVVKSKSKVVCCIKEEKTCNCALDIFRGMMKGECSPQQIMCIINHSNPTHLRFTFLLERERIRLQP